MNMKKLSLALCCLLLGAAGAWAAPSPKENFSEAEIRTRLQETGGAVFPIGDYNSANVNNFTGDSYVASLASLRKLRISNVTFVNGAHTYWHIHHGTCQILMPVSGRGYYQIWGEAPKELRPGETVIIPEGTKHWHGAAPGAFFQHIAMMEPVEYRNEWLEPVDAEAFSALK